MPDSCSREGPLPELLSFPPQAPSLYTYRISLSMRSMGAKGHNRAAAQEAGILRAPLATKPCLYSVHTVM